MPACSPRRSRGRGGKRLRSLAPSREAKQSIFQFLLEEKGSHAKIEKREKCFVLRPASGGGGAAGRVNSAQSRFGFGQINAPESQISLVPLVEFIPLTAGLGD